jgi:prevent-host-death family protein
MKKANISDLKNNLSKYLDFVRKGEMVEILDREIPVAVIVSISEVEGKSREGRILELERKGILRRGDSSVVLSLQKTPPPGKQTGALKALLEEREEQE